MLSWVENVLKASANAKSEQEFFDEILRAAQSIGFEYCAYGMRLALPASRPKYFLINNYPAQWCARYAEMSYADQDPTVVHGARSYQPVVWSNEVFASTPQLWDEAQHAGLRVGWAQSSPTRNGIAGMLSLARSGESFTQYELEENSVRMRWLASIAHTGFLRLVDARRVLSPLAQELTDREREVLIWTAAGKTIPVISEILLISPDTVRFHTRKVLEKLNVANRAAAVAHAAYLGLLD